MNTWLICSLSPGMLTGEYAVEAKTLEGRIVSLFAPEDKVIAKDNLLRVDVLQENPNYSLIYLPSPAFEISSRRVKVPNQSLVRV